MSEIALRGNFDLASLSNLSTNLESVKQTMKTSSADPYLRMGKDGIWIYGSDNVEVRRGSEWAIHPMSVEHGYVCWSRYDDPAKPNEKLGEVMVPSGQPKPDVLALAKHPFDWTEQVSFTLVCVHGEGKGTQTKYSCASIGGMNAVKELLGVMVERIKEEQKRGALTADKSQIVPVVSLEHSHYIHKKHGKIYTPQFNLVRWATLANQDKPNGAASEPAPAVNADPDAADAPRRRRRA
jgi:hypothetical protein